MPSKKAVSRDRLSRLKKGFPLSDGRVTKNPPKTEAPTPGFIEKNVPGDMEELNAAMGGRQKKKMVRHTSSGPAKKKDAFKGWD